MRANALGRKRTDPENKLVVSCMPEACWKDQVQLGFTDCDLFWRKLSGRFSALLLALSSNLLLEFGDLFFQ